MAGKLLGVAPKKAKPKRPKILIFGVAGAGKTWGSLDFPDCYYVDTEGGATQSHYTDKLDASGALYMGQEHGALDYETVIDQVKALATGGHDRKTLIVDSLTKLYNEAAAEAEQRVGNDFGRDKKEANKPTRQLISWLGRVDMNAILICHAKANYVDGEMRGYTADIWDKVGYELDLVLEIQVRGDKRVAIVRKSRLKDFPDSLTFPWAYDEFAKRYGRKDIERKVQTLELATDAEVGELEKLIELVNVPASAQAKWLKKAGVEGFADMSGDEIRAVIDMLKAKLQKAAK